MENFALNMLIWNAQDLLKKSLYSTLPYVDEAKIIDTGSTDNTLHILDQIKQEFPFLEYEQIDVQNLGEVWTGSKKDVALTQLLNKLKRETKSKWILKVDDDEIFPDQLMNEIVDLKPKSPYYAISFYHVEGDKIINPYYHRHLRVIRLFQNCFEISWNGSYGKETIAWNGRRVGAQKAPGFYNRFLHLGEFRKGSRYHDCQLHEKGHCGIPIPENYKQYVPHHS